ncbi:hypothetical protein [Pantoea cypripedii]|uniref:Uncharacterized protein n=1 Tax=Pantoea cypripedii TaxID=55209 RepID=A0A6B9GF44_PANCY|nr:hypothetical protein [Pantoea cypripedii]QGY31656.1 hypothetical protein CUN67_21985 [Pantoea cypripedii]
MYVPGGPSNITSLPVHSAPEQQNNALPVKTISNSRQNITSLPSSVIGPESLHDLLGKKITPIETIVQRLNGEFAAHPGQEGKVLSRIFSEFSSGNHIQHAHFNALLAYLDNGIENKREVSLTLAKNICRGFEINAPNMNDEHNIKLLSTLRIDRLSSVMAQTPKIKNIIDNDTRLNTINYQRQVKIHELEKMVEKISPESKIQEVTPYKFNYKKGLHIESYHLKDENGKVFEATFVDNQGKISSNDIENFKEVIKRLYKDNMEVVAEEIKLPDEEAEYKSHFATLFERTNRVALRQWLGDQDNKTTPWTLDSAAVAYGNKKEKFIAILDTLEKFHKELAPLKEEKKFGFDSYAYLNPETILIDQKGASISFDPSPLIVRGLIKQENLQRTGKREYVRIIDSMYPEKFLSEDVRKFKTTQNVSCDLFSMSEVWEKMFGVNINNYDHGPFEDTLIACREGAKSKHTVEKFKDDLSKKEFKDKDDLEKLCLKRAGEKPLLDHVQKCLDKPGQGQEYRTLILETAAMLLAHYRSDFDKAAKDWT